MQAAGVLKTNACATISPHKDSIFIEHPKAFLGMIIPSPYSIENRSFASQELGCFDPRFLTRIQLWAQATLPLGNDSDPTIHHPHNPTRAPPPPL